MKGCARLLLVLWSVLVFANADNIIKLPPQKVATRQIAVLSKEIDTLEQNSKNFDEYTTKYFRKRVDYSSPFSSEARDYQDSIIIEREKKSSGATLRYNKNPTNEVKRESAHNLSKSNLEQKPSKNNLSQNALTSASLNLPKPFLEPKKTYNKVLDSHKPKVVIIIDDIANTRQLGEVQSVGLKLTPSIFPTDSAKMRKEAQKLDFYMVHLPLEANAYKDELETIKLSDSEAQIHTQIAKIKQNLPQTRYINNHTGSKFTQNRANMELLLSILDSHNINFVDSRTTQNTALPDIAKAQNRLILYRDIFIDNALDSHSLNAQISEGVKIAQDRGYAILIAHPHKETLNALKIAKDGALKEVEVIYLNELDSLLQKSNIAQYAQVLKSP